jgi:hypothetical protein
LLGTKPGDAYHLDLDTLFYASSHRGLVALDVASAPRFLARLPLEGQPKLLRVAGDRAYVVSTHAYRLSPDPEGGLPLASYGAAVSIVDIVNPSAPRLLDATALPGDPQDAYLRGDFLYLVTDRPSWHSLLDRGLAVDETRIAAIDLRQPARVASEIVRQRFAQPYGSRLSVPLGTTLVHFAEAAAFVAEVVPGRCWDEPATRVQLFDLGGPEPLRLRGEVLLPGAPPDAQALHRAGDVLWVATGAAGSAGGTMLSAVSFADPDWPTALGAVRLSSRPLLSARYGAGRAWLATAADSEFWESPPGPLWVVDLSDPGRPRPLGELTLEDRPDALVPLGDGMLMAGERRRRNSPSEWGRVGLGVSLLSAPGDAAPSVSSRFELGGDWGSLSTYRGDLERNFLLDSDRGRIALWYMHQRRIDGDFEQSLQLVSLEATGLRPLGAIPDVWPAWVAVLGGGDLMTLENWYAERIDTADPWAIAPSGRAEIAPAGLVLSYSPLSEDHGARLLDHQQGARLELVRAGAPNDDSLASVPVPVRFSNELFANEPFLYLALGAPDASDSFAEIRVYDASNPVSLRPRGRLALLAAPAGPPYPRPSRLLAVHPTLLAYLGEALHLLDMADPDAPRVRSTIELGPLSPVRFLVAGDLIAIVSVDSRGKTLLRVDVSQPDDPRLLPALQIASYNAAVSDDGSVFEHDGRGVLIRDANSLSPRLASLPGIGLALAWTGDRVLALVADPWPSSPSLADPGRTSLASVVPDAIPARVAGVVRLPWAENADIVQVAAGRAFVRTQQGLLVYNLSGEVPRFETFVQTSRYGASVAVAGGRAFVVGDLDGVTILELPLE